MAITADMFRNVLPGGNFFSDPRLPAALTSSGPMYAPPTSRPGGTSGTVAGNAGAAAPTLPDYSQIDDIIAQINQGNIGAQQTANSSRIPNAPAIEAARSAQILNLLNPPDTYGELDVPAAASAVASGTVGSPFAGITGLNLTREQQQRDIALGSNIANQAYSANPAAPIANAENLLELLTRIQEAARGRQFTAQENALQRSLQASIAALNNNRYGRSGGPAFGTYGPLLPTQYGRPGEEGFSANIPGPSPYYNPDDYPNTTWPIPPAEPGPTALPQGTPLPDFNLMDYSAYA